MTDASGAAGLSPVEAFALVGLAGMGAQWLAWRLRLPAIVMMLVAGLLLGPVTGVFLPERDIGPLTGPMISLAVAVILFEGGLTLSFRKLADARPAVRRLIWLGAPVGWALSSLALAFGAGLSWQSSIVFGGLMIVTGPTVIGPLLRQAKLVSRPAQILQWEGIVNDPIGALAAVIALEIVLVRSSGPDWADGIAQVIFGIGFALLWGVIAGRALVVVFRRNLLPEYMKAPLLFVSVIVVFAGADGVLHESGLLAVTVMGLVVGNAGLASYTELHRFKEQASVLLVSGVFILLAAGVDFGQLSQLTWRTAVFVALVVLVARPLAVMLALIGTPLPWREKLLIALTGPRGVVMVSVAGIFGARLVGVGVPDGMLVEPLAFVLVLATVVLHGFTLAPFARLLGLTSGDKPGLLIVGGSAFATALARALDGIGVRVLIADPNEGHLHSAREAGIATWYGDILGEAAENTVEFLAYPKILAASDNDAYNTLVATDLAPEFGRGNIWQLARHREDRANHTLPAQLGGQTVAEARTLTRYLDLLATGWVFRSTVLTDKFLLEDWREARPGAQPLVVIEGDEVRMISGVDELPDRTGVRIVSLIPPELAERLKAEASTGETGAAASEGAAEEARQAEEKADPGREVRERDIAADEARELREHGEAGR